jgi:hypothetical protein
MPVAAKGRWWNRKIPTKPLAMGFGLVILIVLTGPFYVYFEPALTTCVWSVTHQSTATYQGLKLKVPWMWRQEETPAGQREIHLVRARWAQLGTIEAMVIRNDTSSFSQPQSIEERLRILSSKLGQTTFRGVSFPLDRDTASRYSCIAPHFGKLPDWQVSCLSNDRHWAANLTGPIEDIDDFKAVLRHLALAQN